MEPVVIVDKYVPKKWKKHYLTAEHFAVYCGEIERLMELFRFEGFSVHYQHALIDSKAAYKISPDMTVSFCLSTVWEDTNEPDDEQMRVSARHEFAHALVGMIDILAHHRWGTVEEMTKEFERFAVTMERFLTRLYAGEVEYHG